MKMVAWVMVLGYENQGMTIKEIFDSMGLRYGLIFKIVHRQRWKHLS